MKVIICGPRDFEDYDTLCAAIAKSGFTISEVVSGTADGVDKMGERWARENNIPIKPFPAEWDNLKQPGAVKKKNKWNKWYNANAGFYRNQQMIDYIGADGGVIAIETGSPGTGNTIKAAGKAGCQLFRYKPEDDMDDDDYGYHF